ncbi:dienelactone hydrolase family protein [Natronocalculus amylovorans]|uniref:Dienelactone hydrolase family protein n=1 Tax=Natronocalculus amylovorans TaxID=2917812 RepID=A0AAE3K7X2_9EURY|nr:dienelactone hydrolase family protein [Natronocalculus amylovorans]MCL9816431.1 dienelactone hydrolase family protein [Natronocalculus amylovorans]
MGKRITLPGVRDTPASLDRAVNTAHTVVIACPPHPQHRGHRGDTRLVTISDQLTDRGVDCLRFDYGPWDDGYGECTDADNAVSWATDRYDRVALAGFSFGGAVGLITAAGRGDVTAVSALAPTAQLNPDADAVAALSHLVCPAQIVYATRDTTADWEPLVDRARELQTTDMDISLTEFAADHFFIGRETQVAEPIASFLAAKLKH